MNGKAQLTIQFNWIFVLIVGVSILALLVSFSFRHQDAAETRISTQLAKQYETIFSTTAQQAGAAKEYASPPIQIEFACNTYEDVHNYKINGVVARETPYELIAASEKLSTTRLQTWTLNWHIPFSVDTFLYVTEPLEEVIFYQSGAQPSRELTAILDVYPENFSYRVVNTSFSNIPTLATNNNRYVFVIFAAKLNDSSDSDNHLPDPADLIHTPADRTTILLIQPQAVNTFDSGYVAFLSTADYTNYFNNNFADADLNEQTERYLGQASFFSTFFVKTQERYVCLMNQAFERVEMVSQILYQETLVVDSFIDSSCRDLIVGLDLPGFYGAQQLLANINSTAATTFSKTSANNLRKESILLDRLHNKIAVETYCPLLY